ncbi:MAG: flagellar basal body protein [Firmicutes bacterium]|nr:flagellar basal body protein [Bacillota bacterium]
MDGLGAVGSGMLADERMQQVIMNNIANLSTPGYKQSTGELMAFPQMLAERYMLGDGQDATAIGSMSDGTLFQEAVGNFSQGPITPTNQPLDLAIQDPLNAGTAVYALVPPGQSTLAGGAGAGAAGRAGTGAGGAAGAAQPQIVSTLSFVVGRGGVIETSQGDPVVPVDAAGNPIAGARVIKNPAFKGLELFGDTGAPVVDVNGQPSYHIVGANGQALSTSGVSPEATLRMASAATGGVHAFFAVLNVDASNQTRVALTRDGHFQVASDHYLYDATGQRVLAVGANGQPLQNSAIYVNPAYSGQAIFGANGVVLRDGQGNPSYEVVNATTGRPLAGAAFGTVAVDVNSLQPLGQSDYVMTPTTQIQRSQATIQAGALEGSNTNSTQSMVDMLNVFRNYQADQDSEQTISQAMMQAAQQVGTVPGL